MVCSKQEICICINEQNNSLSHKSVASRLIEWQLETQGHAPFLRTLAIRSVRSDAWMLASAKTRIGRGWDFVSRISRSETHRTAARNTGALSVSARALTLCMQRACPQGCAYAAMRGCSPRLNRTMGLDGTWSHRMIALPS
jgi:hypothetical protein